MITQRSINRGLGYATCTYGMAGVLYLFAGVFGMPFHRPWRVRLSSPVELVLFPYPYLSRALLYFDALIISSLICGLVYGTLLYAAILIYRARRKT